MCYYAWEGHGYYYEAETGWYWLTSRYYDPEVGRFINADALVSTGQGFIGFNMFAYCLNNPVNLEDYGGLIAGKPKTMIINDGAAEDEDRKRSSRSFSEKNEIAEILDADGTTYYRGRRVEKCDWMDENALSFGTIFMASNITSETIGGEQLLKHEYGHTLQLEEMGVVKYTLFVGAPSIVSYGLKEIGWLPCRYYSLPQEFGADMLGEVEGREYDSWAPKAYLFYYALTLIEPIKYLPLFDLRGTK